MEDLELPMDLDECDRAGPPTSPGGPPMSYGGSPGSYGGPPGPSMGGSGAGGMGGSGAPISPPSILDSLDAAGMRPAVAIGFNADGQMS
eukprot:189451-Rhodomonas_salina.2